MDSPVLKLAKAPIIEAVLDIDCDLPPGFELATIEEPARNAFRGEYPKFRKQFIQEHKIAAKPGTAPQMSVRSGIQALQFLQEDEKQLIQTRVQGYSFNRLAPYSSLDDYLPEIDRTWRLFLDIASPIQITRIRLRYINRILLPPTEGAVRIDDYLKVGPRLPDEDNLTFVGFLNQHTAVESATGHQINIVLTSQPSIDDRLPIIFDNCVTAQGPAETQDWPWILDKIRALRSLKNRIFQNTLTQQCLDLFQ